MFSTVKRGLLAVLATMALAACQVVPQGQTVETSAPPPQRAEVPNESALPSDETRHRVALLVPLSGPNGEVGQAIANATTMALLDTGADNLRITTYDTGPGAGTAAARAVADGNRLILGPLLRDDVGPVLAQARPSDVPLITFSNDAGIARSDVFVMGPIPEQAIARAVGHALANGSRRVAAILPQDEYGDRALAALQQALPAGGGQLAGVQRFSRGNNSIVAAASRLNTAGGFDTVLIADGARTAVLAAAELRPAGGAGPVLLGTDLWSSDAGLPSLAALRGARFAAVSDERFGQFADSYQQRFGSRPNRIATLGYDAVLLTLRVARDWQVGRPFPTARLVDDGGFLGLDGPFRFRSNGRSERAMEVRQIGAGAVQVVDRAPARF